MAERTDRMVSGGLGSHHNPVSKISLQQKVYVLDIRNHGDSPHVSEMTFDLMARDTVQFLKERDTEKTVLIGHSLGGASAMYTTLKYPQLVERLVVLDSSPERPRKQASNVDQLLGALRELDIRTLINRREADRQLQDKIPSAPLRDFLLTNLHMDEQTGQLKWKANLDILHKALPHLTAFPDVGGASYNGPTLFLGGGNSDIIGEDSIPAIQRLFPSATVQHIPGAGHLLHVDKPAQFLETLTDFIQTPLSS
jgi:pimeloyl-ACP methyl ester carboxylesterase